MRLYVTRGTLNTGDGAIDKALEFTGNQADARKSAREFQDGTRGMVYEDVYWEPFDIPTDKTGLLEFLNQYTPGGIK